MKTKALNVLGFLPWRRNKIEGKIYEYQADDFSISFFDVTLISGLLKCITNNGIGPFSWDIFSWSFFPIVKTKALNVLGFLPWRRDKIEGKIYEYQADDFSISFFDVTLISGLLKCITNNGIGPFSWDIFSWSFFPIVKTKALNVLGFLPWRRDKIIEKNLWM